MVGNIETQDTIRKRKKKKTWNTNKKKKNRTTRDKQGQFFAEYRRNAKKNHSKENGVNLPKGRGAEAEAQPLGNKM